MGAVHVLDDYYLAITLLITIGYQLFFFAIAFTFKFDKLTDFAGGTNFVVLAIITLAFSAARDNARNIVVSVFIMAWGARLSGFLLFRILKTGKDDRFDDKRDKFFSFLGFWVFQMIWVWSVSLPVTLLNSPNVTQYGQVCLRGCIKGLDNANKQHSLSSGLEETLLVSFCSPSDFSWRACRTSRNTSLGASINMMVPFVILGSSAGRDIPITSVKLSCNSVSWPKRINVCLIQDELTLT